MMATYTLSRPTALRLGSLFVLLELVVIARNIAVDYMTFYWYCDFASALFAFLFFTRNVQAVKGLIHVGLIGQVTFLVAYFGKLLLGRDLMGFDISLDGGFGVVAAVFVIHLSSLIALFATLREPPRVSSLWYALVFLCAIYLAVRVFTSVDYTIDGNYNYIYSFQNVQNVPGYTTAWIPLVFLLQVLPAFLLQRFLWAVCGSSHASVLGRRSDWQIAH